VVQLGDIGDLVLTSPFLRELGKATGERGESLTLVVKPAVHALAELCPHAGSVLAFDARRARWAGSLSGLRGARQFARSELGSEIGTAWNPRFDLDELGATFLMLYSGATSRIGYSEHVSPSKELRNHGYDCLLSRPIEPAPGASRHEADRLLGLLEAEGVPVADRGLELWLGADDRTAARDALAAAGELTPVALGIGAGHPKRCWPPERFARVAESLHQEHNAIAVLVGGPGERSTATTIEAGSQAPVIDMVGRLPLRATAALISRCALYVGNDSGLLHVATASGLPAVEISCHPVGGAPDHPNSPERFGPYGVPGVVLRPALPASPECAAGCESGSPHCIEGVPIDAVLDGVASMLRKAERISP
jgi:heptosyltransferase-2